MPYSRSILPRDVPFLLTLALLLGATIFVGDQRIHRRYLCVVRPQGQTCYGTAAPHGHLC